MISLLVIGKLWMIDGWPVVLVAVDVIRRCPGIGTTHISIQRC